jgi:hypothetical protein
VLIHGNGKGADTLADDWAFMRDNVLHWAFPADWDTHGRKAGPIRNQRMLDDGKPDLVLAFVDKPLEKSRGTADMVRRAHKADVPVYVVERWRPRPVVDTAIQIHGPFDGPARQQGGMSPGRVQAIAQEAFEAGRRRR